MTARIRTALFGLLVVALSVVFAALTIADAAEHAPAAGRLADLLP